MAVDKLLSEGYGDIKANLPDHQKPDIIPGLKESFRPDIMCSGAERTLIGSVETCSSLVEPRADDKWVLFDDYASKKRWEFRLFVPESCPSIGSGTMEFVLSRFEQLGMSSGQVKVTILPVRKPR